MGIRIRDLLAFTPKETEIIAVMIRIKNTSTRRIAQELGQNPKNIDRQIRIIRQKCLLGPKDKRLKIIVKFRKKEREEQSLPRA